MAVPRTTSSYERFQRVLLALAIPPGLFLSWFGASSLTVLLAGEHWTRWAIGAVVVLIVPAVVLDRMLPRTDAPLPSLGTAGQVLAICWLAFPLTLFGPAIRWTEPMLRRDAERWTASPLSPLGHAIGQLLPRQTPPTMPMPLVAERPLAPLASAVAAPSALPPPAPILRRTDLRPQTARWTAATPDELLTDWSPRLVSVTSSTGQSSGLLLTETGRVIASRSTLGSLAELIVTFANGSSCRDVSLHSERSDLDLVLLELRGTTATILPQAAALTRGPRPASGAVVIALRNPLGLGPGVEVARWLTAENAAEMPFQAVTLEGQLAAAGELLLDEKGRLVALGTVPAAARLWPQRAAVPLASLPMEWWEGLP